MAFTTYDNAPYLYRKSGGGGDKEIDKLVGGTIAWNQLVQNGDFADGSTSWHGSKGSVSNGEATVTINGSWNNDIRQHLNTVANHVYFGMFKAKSASLSTQTVWFAQVNTSDDAIFARCTALTTGYKTACGIGKTTVNGAAVRLVLQENGSSLTNQTFNVDDVNLFDLTLMFGSTIADYVYSLEQSSEGSGLAWLRSYGFFTEDYYDYNSGELKSVSNLVSHDMTGEDTSTTLHSYPLGNVTLRGLPKLNGNALYYDGDSYESNGTVTRKYGVVDLGTLNWEKATAYSNIPYFRAHPAASVGASTMCICSKYATTSFSVLVSDSGDKTVTTASNGGWIYIKDSAYTDAASFKTAMSGVNLVYELATPTAETADTYTNPQWVDPNGTERYTLSSNAFPMPVGHETTYNTDMGSKTVNTQVNLSMTEPSVRQVYAKEGDTARVLNIHLDQTEEDGTLRILRPDGTEVTAEAVLVPEFYDVLMAEIPSDATEIVGKCYCDVEQNGVSSMPFTLNVKKNERES